MAGGVDTYFSVFALFILFRETIEASLIVGVLLQFLNRSFPHLKKQVWYGVVAGVAVSIAFGVVFSIVFYVAKENVFTGENKAIFKGSIAWFAGGLITILAFAMCRYRGWEEKIRRKLESRAQEELAKADGGDVEAPPPTRAQIIKDKARTCWAASTAPFCRVFGACWAATCSASSACWASTCRASRAGGAAATQCLPPRFQISREPPAKELKSEIAGVGENVTLAVDKKDSRAIFLVVFTTVMREGIESVVFLAGVGNAKPSSLPLPGLVGLVCGILAGMFLYYSGKTVRDIKWFLLSMAVVLFFIAGGQFLLGTDFLITGGMFGYCSPWLQLRPWYMQPLWDISGCCGDTDDKNKFFALVRAIFGYQDKPVFVEVMVYGGYWIVVTCLAIYKYRTGSLFDADYKWKREQAKKQREAEAAQQLQLEMAGSDAAALAKKLADAETAPSLTASNSQDGEQVSERDSQEMDLQQQQHNAPDAALQQVVLSKQ